MNKINYTTTFDGLAQVTFNTGNEYTAEGQVITATCIATEELFPGEPDLGLVYVTHFHDRSRGIAGIVKVHEWDHDSIYRAYENGNYTYACQSLNHEIDEYHRNQAADRVQEETATYSAEPKDFPDTERVTLNQLKASTPRPVVVTYKGHEFNLVDSSSWVEYRVIDSDGVGQDMNSIAEVREWIRDHVGAAEEMEAATALVITREFLGRSRVIREFDNLADAKAEMLAMHQASQSLTTARVVEISKDLTVMSVRGYRGSEYPTYYRIEVAA